VRTHVHLNDPAWCNLAPVLTDCAVFTICYQLVPDDYIGMVVCGAVFVATTFAFAFTFGRGTRPASYAVSISCKCCCRKAWRAVDTVGIWSCRSASLQLAESWLICGWCMLASGSCSWPPLAEMAVATG
jgi:hypothetical protein